MGGGGGGGGVPVIFPDLAAWITEVHISYESG